MLFDLSFAAIVFCLVVVYVGAAVQSTVGIGLGMLAAPLLTLVDESLVPGVIVLVVMPLSLSMLWAERAAIDWSGFKSAFVGRIPGVVIGAVIAARLSATVLALAGGDHRARRRCRIDPRVAGPDDQIEPRRRRLRVRPDGHCHRGRRTADGDHLPAR